VIDGLFIPFVSACLKFYFCVIDDCLDSSSQDEETPNFSDFVLKTPREYKKMYGDITNKDLSSKLSFNSQSLTAKTTIRINPTTLTSRSKRISEKRELSTPQLTKN
jgi:hypothetical protein